MTDRKTKLKSKRASRASGARKLTANVEKTANAGRAKGPAKAGEPASRPTDRRIRDLGDWREETLARMRALILEADPEMVEERKWKKPSNAMAGIPVWSHHGLVCTGETYSKVVKLTFAQGARIPDPSRLFNSSLEGNTRRAIDIHKGEKVDEDAFKTLVKAAVAKNGPLSELHGLSERWFRAWLEKDATTVERLMAEDYLYVGPNGLNLDRQAILNIVRSPSYRLDHATRTEVVVRALGHQAGFVRHRYQGAGSFEGTSFSDDHRCVMIWETLGGEWRLVNEQCSFSSEERERESPRVDRENRAEPSASGTNPIDVRESENAPVALLSGGNPRIGKADGDAPVQAYITAMPGWKRELGKRLDALIVRNAPSVRKAVKWNSPFYGIEGRGWFLSFHVFTRYVKVAFFRGAALRPVPPGAGKDKNTRYLDIHEDDDLDETRMASWVKQAAALTGWVP